MCIAQIKKNNILVRDLCKQFDKFLLDHVSFQVPKGRIVGFIGENIFDLHTYLLINRLITAVAYDYFHLFTPL